METELRIVGDANVQPVVVFLNGLVQRSYQWDAYQKALASKGFASVAFNFPGQGRCEDTAFDGSLDDLADITRAVIERIGSRDVYLCGLSAGAAVALRYASRHPEGVKGLVSISGFSRMDTLMTALHQALLNALHLGGIAQMFDLLVAFNFRSEWIKKNQLVLALSKNLCVQDNNKATVAGFLRAILDVDHCDLDLGNFGKPALLLGGDSDPIVPRWNQDALHAQLAHSACYIARGASHALPMEKPELTLKLLTEFLESVENGSWVGDRTAYLVRDVGDSVEKIRSPPADTA